MLVKEYFKNVDNLRDRLLCRDAVYCNSYFYMALGREGNILNVKGINSNVLAIDFTNLGEWQYDEWDCKFTTLDGKNITFYDMEVYEP